MVYLKVGLRRLLLFPLVLLAIPFISFVMFVLNMDRDWYDTRETILWLVDLGWNGLR